jgi:hypothetical protein
MTELVMRDRLLLAFTDLRSFGIVAELSVSGSITEATAFMEIEAAHRAPYAQCDYVFWLEADDAAAFDAAGTSQALSACTSAIRNSHQPSEPPP